MFKLGAVKAYKEGASFDVDIIGRKKPKHCLTRWRNMYIALGEAGLLEEQRGKVKTCRGTNQALEMENDFLKKLGALEKQKMQRKR